MRIWGKPALVPKRALGWHLSRWGWNSTETLRDVVKSMEKGNFPLDGMWTDIDYMKNYQDFTIDNEPGQPF